MVMVARRRAEGQDVDLASSLFAVLCRRRPQGQPASPVPARDVDRSAVIEVGAVC
jgi:hypothetical protein